MTPAQASVASRATRAPQGIGLLLGALAAAGALAADTPPPAQPFTVTPLALPGADGVVSLDYFVFDERGRRLWVPASNTGNVVLIDGRTDEVSTIGGFRTAAVEFRGKHPVMGPSSVALGDGVAYVGNRGDSTVCAIDVGTLKVGACLPLAAAADGIGAAPDAVTYVAATRELWVTRGVPPLDIPSSDLAITVLDASEPARLRTKTKIALGASAEGFAVDELRGRFYTSLEEQALTVSIDVRRHAIVARWRSGCDEPHGLALDAARGVLLVACNARVVALDVAHDGRVLGSLETGAGLDNIAYLPSRALLYAAAADAARLTVARVEKSGTLTPLQSVPTVKGARGVVVDPEGRAFVMDPLGGRILKISFQ